MQSALLQLSELASAVTDMDAFYNALESVIKTLLVTDSFHIALLNSSNELKLTHCHNPLEKGLCEQVDLTHWQKSLSGLVVMRQQKLHCSANKRRVLANADEIILYDSEFKDWLGVPLKRNQQVIGVIALQSYDEALSFSAKDCQILEGIAEHLVTAIDRVRSLSLIHI